MKPIPASFFRPVLAAALALASFRAAGQSEREATAAHAAPAREAAPAVAVAPAPARVRALVDSSDPFQRHVTFYNDMPFTVWPVFQSPQDSNCTALLGSKLLRLHVNFQTKDAGIPPTKSVTVAIPKEWPCANGGFYSAVRIFVFTGQVSRFEADLPKVHQDNQVTTPYSDGLKTPICGNDLATDPCWTGTAPSAYALDAPAQLLEYTIISQNAKGEAYANANEAKGVPFFDFDVSYVDEAYLPAVMAIDNGRIQYMGSNLGYEQFRVRLTDFITQTKWPQYAAFADLNFKAVPANRTIFAGLLTENGVGQSPRVPSGNQAVSATFTGDGSPFYTPSWDGVYPRECVDPLGKANVECSVLLPMNQFCCPDANGMQGCCDAKNYLIDKVVGNYNKTTKTYRYSSAVLKDLTKRFSTWTDTFDCVNPPAAPVTDRKLFCDAFKKTLRFAWKAFIEQDATGAKQCSGFAHTDARFDECITATLIGYKIDTTHAKDIAERCKTCPAEPCPRECLVEKQLNESVQALLRGVPWTSSGPPASCGPEVCPSLDSTKCSPSKCVFVKADQASADARLWHFNKFLHFWAAYDSVYNLNPYARLIHDKDALSAPGAYSFSIDDFYGNFGGPGSDLIVDMGGVGHAPNPEPYDPYKQYHVAVGAGWHHMDLCGRRVDIPQGETTHYGIDLGTPFSFYQPDGRRTDPCVVTIFEDAAETRFVRYKLSEVHYDVVDTDTNVTHPVSGLSGVWATLRGDLKPVPDNAFCKDPANSTPDLVAKGKCTGNLSPVGYGNRDAYNSVKDHCTSNDDAQCGRPLTSLNVPARIPF